MKTSELTGAQLDYWVARAEGLALKKVHADTWSVEGPEGHSAVHRTICPSPAGPDFTGGYLGDWSPSTKWDDGGPIIERMKIMVSWNADHWVSGANDAVDNPKSRIWSGRTALIAAMRAHVASKFGDEVPN